MSDVRAKAVFVNISINIQQAHQRLHHMNKEFTQETAKYIGCEI